MGAAGRAASLVLLTVLELVLGVLAIALVPFRVGGHLAPVCVLVAVAGNLAVTRTGTAVGLSRGAAAVPALAWMLLVATLGSSTGPGGDVVVTTGFEGVYLALVLLGTVAATIGLATGRAGAGSGRHRTDGIGGPDAG